MARMGFIQNVKAETIGAEARKVAESGVRIFTPRLAMPSTKPGMTGNIGDWALMISAIEAEGWQLVHWTVGDGDKGRPDAFPVFRRA